MVIFEPQGDKCPFIGGHPCLKEDCFFWGIRFETPEGEVILHECAIAHAIRLLYELVLNSRAALRCLEAPQASVTHGCKEGR